MNIFTRLFGGKKDSQKEELGRNDACWCGSGKKYKRCHLEADANKRRNRSGLGLKKK